MTTDVVQVARRAIEAIGELDGRRDEIQVIMSPRP